MDRAIGQLSSSQINMHGRWGRLISCHGFSKASNRQDTSTDGVKAEAVNHRKTAHSNVVRTSELVLVFQGEAAQETVEFSSLGPKACRLQFRVSVTLIFHMKLMTSWYQNRCVFSARVSTFGTVAARRVFVSAACACGYEHGFPCMQISPTA
jgi:hypothetical protein